MLLAGRNAVQAFYRMGVNGQQLTSDAELMHGRRSGVQYSKSNPTTSVLVQLKAVYQQYEAFLTASLPEREGVFFDEMDLCPAHLFGPFMSVLK